MENVKYTVRELLPHAPPMILLSGYEEPVDGDSIAAYVDITRDSPFFDMSENGVPGCVAIEYMAQAMALYVGLQARLRNEKPRIGFVLGTRKLNLSIPAFPLAHRFTVSSRCTYTDESFGSFECLIADASGSVVASAQLSAFLPDEGFSLEAGSKV